MNVVIHFKNNIVISNGWKPLSDTSQEEDFSKKFYVASRKGEEPNNTLYCHTDGHWQRGTYSEQGYTGYFDTIEEAMLVANLTDKDILERKEY